MYFLVDLERFFLTSRPCRLLGLRPLKLASLALKTASIENLWEVELKQRLVRLSGLHPTLPKRLLAATCILATYNKVTPKTKKSAICTKLPQKWVPRYISIKVWIVEYVMCTKSFSSWWLFDPLLTCMKLLFDGALCMIPYIIMISNKLTFEDIREIGLLSWKILTSVWHLTLPLSSSRACHAKKREGP